MFQLAPFVRSLVDASLMEMTNPREALVPEALGSCAGVATEVRSDDEHVKGTSKDWRSPTRRAAPRKLTFHRSLDPPDGHPACDPVSPPFQQLHAILRGLRISWPPFQLGSRALVSFRKTIMQDDDSINGNRYLAFTELIRLDEAAATTTSDGTFKSAAKAFAPGGGTSAYGGHVFAQAAWAAAQTVKEGFVLHVRTR